MKRIVLTLLACICLACVVSGETASTSVDHRIVLIGESDSSVRDVINEKVDVDEIFYQLESNTEKCLNDCEGIYIFRNPTNKDLSISKKRLRFYNRDFSERIPESVNVTDIRFYDFDTRERLYDLDVFPASTTVAIRILAVKNENVDVDWVPGLCLDVGDFPEFEGKLDELCMYQSEWALWGMVDTVAQGGTGVEQSPLVYYDFDVGDFPTDDVIDKSGNGNDGSVTGATSTLLGIRNNGTFFDGVNDEISLADPDILTNTKVSMCAYFNYTSNADNAQITSFCDTADATPFGYVRVSDNIGGKLRFAMRDHLGTTIAIVGQDDLRNAGYHSVCGVIEDDFAVLYQDGVEVNRTAWSGTGDFSTGVDSFKIGTNGCSPVDDFWNNTLDEIRIFNYALTAKQAMGYHLLNANKLTVTTPDNVTYSNAATIPLDVDVQVGVPAVIEVGIDNNISSRTPDYFQQLHDGIALFRFDGSTENSWADDTVTHTGAETYVPGEFSQAFDYDGVTQVTKICDSGNGCTWGGTLFNGDGGSVCGWMTIPETGQPYYMGRFDTLDDNRFWYVSKSANDLLFKVYSNGASSPAATATLTGVPINERHFYCFVFDGAANIYLDGALNVSNGAIVIDEGAWADDEDTDLGGYEFSARRGNVTLDDFAFYQKPLGAETVKELYERERISYLDTDTVLRLDFEQNITFDSSNYENHGTNNGVTQVEGRFGSAASFDGESYIELPATTLTTNLTYTLGGLFNITKKDNPDGNRSYLISPRGSFNTELEANYLSNVGNGFRFAIYDGTDTTAIEAVPIVENQIYEVYGTYDGTDMKLYVDGVLVNQTDSNPPAPVAAGSYIGTVNGAVRMLNGTAENVVIADRAFTESEIVNRGLGDIRWRNDSWWTLEGSLNVNVTGTVELDDSVNLTFTGCNTAGFCTSEQRDITIGEESPPIPFMEFVAQNPPDITNINLFDQYVNITYNVSGELNIDFNRTWIEVNTSSGCWIYGNGSCIIGGNISGVENYVFTQNLNVTRGYIDNTIYPGTYNLDEPLMEATLKENLTLADSSEYAKTRLYDVDSSKEYGILEIMIKELSSPAPLRIYYCNDGYISGNVANDLDCAQFGSIVSGTPANHSHTEYSKHWLVPFTIDTGEINGVSVTNESYFLLRGNVAGDWQQSYVTLETRPDQFEYSFNNGNSWTPIGGTADLHLHQYNGDEYFRYFFEACNATVCQNSSVRADSLNLTRLPPNAPDVFLPVFGNYTAVIETNWTNETSPNPGITIDRFNVTYWDDNFALLEILQESTLDLGYTWDTSSYACQPGYVGVQACDEEGLCGGEGFSEYINIDNQDPTLTVSSPTQDTNYQVDVPVEMSGADACTALDTLWYDNGTDDVIYTTPETISMSEGSYTWDFYSNDTVGNTQTTDVDFTVTGFVSNVTLLSINPVYTSAEAGTTAGVTVAKGTNDLDKTWINIQGKGNLNVTSASEGLNNLHLITTGYQYGAYYATAFVNDSAGNVGITVDGQFFITTTTSTLPQITQKYERKCFQQLTGLSILDAALCPYLTAWGVS